MWHQLGLMSGTWYACLLVGSLCGTSESQDRETHHSGARPHSRYLVSWCSPLMETVPPSRAPGSDAARITPTTSCKERHALSSCIRFTHTLTLSLLIRRVEGYGLAPTQGGPRGRPSSRLERKRRTLTRGCEPLSHTLELFGPSSSLHSFEHAGKRAFGGCRGVRKIYCTQRNGTQLRGTLTRRNDTRYATDATLTQMVPKNGTDFC